MFEQENQFYEENKESLRRQYMGKEVVIVGDKVIAAYDDLGTALRETAKTYPPGTFTVKKITAEDEIIRIPMYWLVNG